MKKQNIIFAYWKNEALKIGKEKNYKYIILWVDNFIKYIFNNNDLISVELLKNEMPKYYNKMITK